MGNCYPLAHRSGYKINPVTGFTAATWESGTVCVYWTAPADHYSGVMVRYKLGAYPVSPTDGDLLGDGAGGSLELSYQNYVNGFLKSGLTVGNTYYISAFSYALSAGGSRHYSKTIAHAVWTAETIQPSAGSYTGSGGNISGIGYAFYTNGIYTVPAGIRALDVFCVGGGGGGGAAGITGGGNVRCGGGGGGGYTVTVIAAAVTPGQQIQVTIGPGGSGGTQYSGDDEGAYYGYRGGRGGTTSFGSICSAVGGYGGSGGYGEPTEAGANDAGGNGGSGGGAPGLNTNGAWDGGEGGTNGGSGNSVSASGSEGFYNPGGAGQGATTTAFGGNTGTIYSGGGGGGRGYSGGYVDGGVDGGGRGGPNGTAGTANTGGGGGGGGYRAGLGNAGGSGIVIIRRAA